MADANPSNPGKISAPVVQRDTATPVRWREGMPVAHPHDLDEQDGATGHHHGDEGDPGTKGAARNKHRAEHRRENKFAGGINDPTEAALSENSDLEDSLECIADNPDCIGATDTSPAPTEEADG
jgi:hypothetical protein